LFCHDHCSHRFQFPLGSLALSVPSSEYLQGRRFDPFAQHRLQATACHYISLATKDLGGTLLHVHNLKQTEHSALVIEEQVDVGVRAGLVPV
jgi:hypothetical protein